MFTKGTRVKSSHTREDVCYKHSQNKTSVNIQTMQRINTRKRGGLTTKAIGWHFTDKNSHPINMEI